MWWRSTPSRPATTPRPSPPGRRGHAAGAASRARACPRRWPGRRDHSARVRPSTRLRGRRDRSARCASRGGRQLPRPVEGVEHRLVSRLQWLETLDPQPGHVVVGPDAPRWRVRRRARGDLRFSSSPEQDLSARGHEEVVGAKQARSRSFAKPFRDRRLPRSAVTVDRDDGHSRARTTPEPQGPNSDIERVVGRVAASPHIKCSISRCPQLLPVHRLELPRTEPAHHEIPAIYS